jgi:hypothetical protein
VRFKTITLRAKNDYIKLEVNVNSSGKFTTLLPVEITKELKRVCIKLFHGGKGLNKAKYEASSFDELIKTVRNDLDLLNSVETISKELIIRYQINIACAYGKKYGDSGEIIPNGTFVDRESDYQWFSGNTEIMSPLSRKQTGIHFYAEPFLKRTLKKALDGSLSYEFDYVPDNICEDKYNLRYLKNLVQHKEYNHDCYLKEMKYTEERAKFFVDMHRWICGINEKMNSFLNDDEAFISALDAASSFLLIDNKE